MAKYERNNRVESREGVVLEESEQGSSEHSYSSS